MSNEEPMTQERREAFWRTFGWSPDLPEAERKQIEIGGPIRRSRRPKPSASDQRPADHPRSRRTPPVRRRAREARVPGGVVCAATARVGTVRCWVYREQVLELTRKNPHAASVYVYDEDEYRAMRLLVTDDGKAGVALKGDEIVSVFAHKDCAHPRAARAMLRHATALGGTGWTASTPCCRTCTPMPGSCLWHD